jgi:tetratricopeptide (TPR) repeat protein
MKIASQKLILLTNHLRTKIMPNRGVAALRKAEHFRRNIILLADFGIITIANTESFTLCGTLLNEAGSCLGLTTLYITIGEMLGLPIQAAIFEGHIVPVFLEGSVPIYIETTYPNCVHYGDTITFLYNDQPKILTNEEFLAVHLSNRATQIYARVGLMDDAVFLIDSALEIFPDYTAGWINRAIIMKQINNVKEMRRSLDIAKSLNPGVRYTKAIERIENNELITT